MDVNQVLAQMRTMEAAAKGVNFPSNTTGNSAVGNTEPATKTEFSQAFTQAVNSVNEAQSTSSKLTSAFVSGSEKVDLPDVMIAVQEASISFQAISQVRNRLLSAYQDVMNMPV